MIVEMDGVKFDARPQGDRLLVQEDPPRKSVSGIHVAEGWEDKYRRLTGTVVGTADETNPLLGKRVLFGRHAGNNEHLPFGERLLMLRPDEISVVLHETGFPVIEEEEQATA